MDECCYEGNISFEWEISRLLSWLTGAGKPVCRADIVLIPKWSAFLKGILESLPGALTYSGYDLSESSPFALPAGQVTWQEIRQMMLDGKVFGGQAGEETYLAYYSHHCNAVGVLELPTEHVYGIEIIDVWDMTKEVA